MPDSVHTRKLSRRTALKGGAAVAVAVAVPTVAVAGTGEPVVSDLEISEHITVMRSDLRKIKAGIKEAIANLERYVAGGAS